MTERFRFACRRCRSIWTGVTLVLALLGTYVPAYADPIDTIASKASSVAGIISIVVGLLILLWIGIQIEAGAAMRSPMVVAGSVSGIFALAAGVAIVFFAVDIFNVLVGTLNEAGRSSTLERFR
ncbi:MAG: hypothetical protein EPO21_03870 [Chloroflexota bacterium]|nr:MAG: hypothetical protein EPO21_03870 [Chloroflexota bacterium]